MRVLAQQAAYFAKEAGASFRRNGLMTAAAVTTIVVALLVVGTAVALGRNLVHLATILESQVAVVAFLRDGLDPHEISRIRRVLAATPGIASVQFVSRADALERLRYQLGNTAAFDDLQAANPLPDSFEIQTTDPERTRTIARAVARVAGIEEVTDGEQVTDRLLALTRSVRILASALTLFLTGVALLVVVNTIRLTVLAREREIEIMRLVGATRWFVQWPLILEGILEGAVAAIAAIGVLAGLYAMGTVRVGSALPFLPLAPVAGVLQAVAITVGSAGLIVGGAGSLIAVRRFVTR